MALRRRVIWRDILPDEWRELGRKILREILQERGITEEDQEEHYRNKIVKERVLDSLTATNTLSLLKRSRELANIEGDDAVARLGLHRSTPTRWLNNEVQPHARLFFGLLIIGMDTHIEEAVGALPSNRKVIREAAIRTVSIIRKEELGRGFDLVLVPSGKQAHTIPDNPGPDSTGGMGRKNSIIVADLDNGFRFCLLDSNGVKTNDTFIKFTCYNKSIMKKIKKIREELDGLWSRHEIPRKDRNRLINSITSIWGLRDRQMDEEEFARVRQFMRHPGAGMLVPSDNPDVDLDLMDQILFDVVDRMHGGLNEAEAAIAIKRLLRAVSEWAEAYTLFRIGLPVGWEEMFHEVAI